MTTNEAKKEGIRAFNEGKKSAPALNNKFIIASCGSVTDTITLLKSYTKGWTIAHLAKDSDSDTPSSIELKRILAS